MKLLLVIVEGHLYLAGIFAIFVAELAFLFWGLWSRRPIIGLVRRDPVLVHMGMVRGNTSGRGEVGRGGRDADGRVGRVAVRAWRRRGAGRGRLGRRRRRWGRAR